MPRVNNKRKNSKNISEQKTKKSKVKNNDDTISLGFYSKEEGKMVFEDINKEDVETMIEKYIDSNPDLCMTFDECQDFFKKLKS